MADTYSAGETAKLLGVSERRVRQLAVAGALDVAQEHPLRIGARSVLDERKRRERRPKPESPAQGLEPAQLRELVSAIVADVVPLALEGQRRVEELLRDELAQSRAETAQLRAQLDERQRKTAGKGGKRKGKRKGKR